MSGEENHLLDLQKVVLRKGGVEKEYTIEEAFTSPLSIKLSGIDSPEDAKVLIGAEVLVPRDLAAPLKKNEFYIEDLRGLEVVVKGKVIGSIDAVFEGGGAFLAEIVMENGEKKLVPFRNEFFGKIDLEAGTVELVNVWILE